MKTFFFTLAALVAFALSGCNQKGGAGIVEAPPHIEGEVFVVTAGGDNKLLGRVEVAAYKPDEVAASFKAVDSEITPTRAVMGEYLEKAKENVADAQQKKNDNEHNNRHSKADDDLKITADTDESNAKLALEYAKGGFKYYAHLPAPIASVKTDSQGKYDLPLSSGDPAILAAHATRLAGDETESYFWIVKCDPSKSTKMTLSNDNLTNSGSKDSVVTTDADANEWDGENGMPVFSAVLAEAQGHSREAQDKARNAAQATPSPESTQPMVDQIVANHKSSVGTPSPETNPALTVDEWKKKAIEQFPQLAVSGSPLNLAFVARFKAYRGTNFFDSPDWPMRLAKECAEAVKGQ